MGTPNLEDEILGHMNNDLFLVFGPTSHSEVKFGGLVKIDVSPVWFLVKPHGH